ncbi:receptor-like protein 12 isoform X1 [Durio zibethinus]|uniref:Receptor-like protein 12 isoform X1 n=2 Tax=Durio zibethinus TaxID=66656 RepID=A0A6P5WNH2_DURZI|nr:receptor-like protein 12 isoform X1 [Durio zibethinus]XP_022717337.1 receptor-like protein 12 isoform X1 [Durio zibethinus]
MFSGSIPSSIFNISTLQVIQLGKNNFSGHLSSDMFNHLSELQSLDLSQNQFSGRIPTSLFKCKELQYLYLSYNQLKGTVPVEIRNLTWLTELALDHNNFQGEIPPIIGNMSFLGVLFLPSNNFTGRLPSPPPSLRWFMVSDNNLVGDIPSSICNVRSLQGLSLFKNNLVGTIPQCLGNLSFSLVDLELQMNNFHGTIPGNFSEGCSLRNFNLNSNQLKGSLPRSWVNCRDLKLLDLANNNLNDTFPHWLGILDIEILVLRSNRFYGRIDNFEVTSSFSHLRIIDLSHNDFIGYLPMKFFENLHAIRDSNKRKAEYMIDLYDEDRFYDNSVLITTKGLELQFIDILTTFTAIDFSSNRFAGQIPEVLGELHSLLVLNLSHNSLTGSIPSVLGNLSALESLDLSSNKLQGRIPQELVNMIFLEVLNLSQNHFVGQIPQGNQFGTFSNDSYIGNLGLCGLPLSKKCDDDQNSETHPIKFDEDDDTTRELNWKFSILMGYGCGLVLGLSMGYIVFTTGKPWWFIRIIERVLQKYVTGKNRRRQGRKQHN